LAALTATVVVDASALIEVLLAGQGNARLIRRLRTAWPVAPEFVEVPAA
jgi:PIN domain nuclease of toxin-antitoxin system